MTTSTITDPNTRKYRSYLLRLWCAETHDRCWCASLEHPHTGERIGFGNLEELFAFLMGQVERDAKGVGMESAELH